MNSRRWIRLVLVLSGITVAPPLASAQNNPRYIRFFTFRRSA